MWTLTSETINKQYYSNLMSRSFLLSAACCLFAFVVPVLLLVAIGYSWNKYAIAVVQPQLSYENHQISCLLSDGTTIYDSSFTNELITNSYRSFLAVGGDQANYAISANIIASNVSACSILIYFRVTLLNLQSLAVLPLQFSNQGTSSTYFTSLTETGIIYARSLSPIPQSSVNQPDLTSYYSNSSQILNMNDVHLTYATKKNVSLISNIVSSQPNYGSSSNSFTYSGTYYVPSQQLLQEVPLISNLRTFIPYFIYLFILMWIFIAQPTVRWMLENKIYHSKTTHPKIKYH